VAFLIKYLHPVSAREASGKVLGIYRQIEEDFLLGEPLILHSLVPDLLAGVWSTFRETFIAGRVKRALKEAVAVAVSRSNRCPFCVDAHAMALRSASFGAEVGNLREGDASRIQDPELRALAEWAEATGRPGTAPPAGPPVPSEDVPEIMGAMVWMQYTNRMVNLFIGEGLIPFPGNRLGLRTLVEMAGGLYFRKKFKRMSSPGESLVFLDDLRAELPKDMAWAAGSPFIAGAFGGLAEAVERGAAESIPPEIRSWFLDSLSRPRDVGLSRRWLDGPLAGLDSEYHAVGTLLQLASRAPHQVVEADIEAFRRERPSERDLLQATAWASFAAARRIAARLAIPPVR
jgi:AhpD family alkylhydroperoxidase